ncbi:hypothetical protein [Aridibaculum aurantiacum]|uniref:hypothetical protein n=1 Tax=Aridibaculum aurantiacum TaxID=2810307 RepID=UPI001A9717D3|nr:hypothetical protein [Aridibaculum aurantiacum]
MADPIAFTKDLFVHGYTHTGGIFSGKDSYWNDLKSNISVKLMAVMNVITNDSYFTNIILFNFLYFFGLVALYRLMEKIYQVNKWVLLIPLFLLPSTLFWCSGIHKDGLILSAVGMLLYTFYNRLQLHFRLVDWLCMLFYLLLIFVLRNYVALALIPALLAGWLSTCYPGKKVVLFAAIYLLGLAIFFIAPHIHPAADFPAFIVSKQHEFSNLQGGSELAVQPLRPDIGSFISYLPTAIDIAFFRPHLTEFRNFSYIPAILEIVAVSLLILFVLIRWKRINFSPFSLSLIFFAISLLLVAGYTITFSGAVVRYRSLALPFLLAPLLAAAMQANKK